MKKILQALAPVLVSVSAMAQVTQINANKSLEPLMPLSNNKAILVSGVDNTLWVSDGTTGGTMQLSANISYEDNGGVINNKFVFAGKTAANGTELWITDGTAAGTTLLYDIMPGATSSTPADDFVALNGYLYFSAISPNNGRELWRTDGTAAGTTMLKDIRPGDDGSMLAGNYNLFSTGNYILFTVSTTAEGTELWITDGTEAGTKLLKDIAPGVGGSSPENFFLFNNTVLFTADDGVHGKELWKTNGSTTGTQLVKDINPGTGGSLMWLLFTVFNGKAYFQANDGTTGYELWSTDATEANTTLVKDIVTGPNSSYPQVITSVALSGKLIFTVLNESFDQVLWETDGSQAGTRAFADVVPALATSLPVLFTPNQYASGQLTQQLFQGNKFFFILVVPAGGIQLWVSDGTAAGSYALKTVSPDDANGFNNITYTYTPTAVYFAADDNVTGDELWKSDGTTAGTTRLTDLNAGASDAEIAISYFYVNNRVMFVATDGDNPAYDLYVVDAAASLPVSLHYFTAIPQAEDAILNWSTTQEQNSKDFVVQRSFDGRNFAAITSVAAAGFSSAKRQYSYTDKGALHNHPVVYYRLLMNDKDGRSILSKVVSIQQSNTANWQVKLVSNPVAADMQLQVLSAGKPVAISIKDVSGRTVVNTRTFNTDGQVTIATHELSAGVYVLVAEQAGERKVIRFVKQ